MKRYRLNKEKFLDFLAGVLSCVVMAGLLVWFVCTWILTA